MLVVGNAAIVSVGDKSCRGQWFSLVYHAADYLPDMSTLVASIVRPEILRIPFFKYSLSCESHSQSKFCHFVLQHEQRRLSPDQ